MDILIKGIELPKEGIITWLTLSHDGRVIVQCSSDEGFESKKELAKAIPVVHCKDCDNFNEETHLCTLWGSWTSMDGFCHKAFAVLERTT